MRGHPSARWSYEDLLLVPEDGKRHELIDGEHLVSPSPTPRHQGILMNLVRVLSAHVHRTRCGKLFSAPLDVVLSPHDVVEPDILFVSAERLHVLGERYLSAAPDLTIEILSPASRRVDLVLKRHLYEKHGVTEYWIVDPEAETVEVLRRRRGHLRPEPAAAVLATPLLPGLALPLAEIFE
jgi:Uma2 family endonuclease